MISQDTYRTILKPSKGIYRDRGSRFIAFAEPAYSQDEVKTLIDEFRKSYHDARHHCYAWMLGHDRNQWRSSDDGEPSGTAGKPILGQINSNDLTNILIVVVRYFGGTLLGTSGLINAYRGAAADSIKNADITERIVRSYYRMSFRYESMNEVMKIVKDEGIIQSEQVFETSCSMKIGIRLSLADQLQKRFSALGNVILEYVETC
jgi:uncharacterized YigZ family protein